MTFDVRHIRVLLWVAIGVAALGFWAFFLVGAESPADPYLPGTASPPPGLAPPGDPARVPLEGFDEMAIHVAPPGGGDWLSWCLLAALHAQQRAQGLMGVVDLQGYSGMVFSYTESVDHPFHMRNTPMALSIAWIDQEGRIVSTADMAPCEDVADCPKYPPGGRYRAAIEVVQGALPLLGIVPGATVSVGGTCAPRA